ncbi:nickel transporter permease [Cohnella sp.]|uniref:nickel transporter permease n=1 Tax=Cohnella sp. TaxID=1883426 RepID=UPI0035643C53
MNILTGLRTRLRAFLTYPMQVAGVAMLLLFLAIALFGKEWAPHDPLLIDMGNRLQAPDWNYPLGTDHLGRCLLSRLLVGAQATLGLSAVVIILVAMIGVPIGVWAGYTGGRWDALLMRIVDGAGALPEFLVAVAIAGFLGPGLSHVMLAIACVKWIGYARLARGIVQAERTKEYIAAAVVSGSTDPAIIRRHVLRHLVSPLAIVAAGDIGRTILLISALSYLGLGAQPPAPEWGAMLNDGRSYFQKAPELMLYPGLCILAVVLACNMISDSLRDRLDVRNRAKLSEAGR